MASNPGALPIKVWVAGIPKGQPRGRAFVTGGKKAGILRVKPSARIFTPGTAESWKGDIALAFRPKMPAEPFACALELVVDLHFKRPKRLERKKDPAHPLPCDGMPDWDNAGKAVSDALEHIGVIANDKTIAFATVRKWYAAKGGRTGATIRLYYVGADAWADLHGEATSREPAPLKLFDEPPDEPETLPFTAPETPGAVVSASLPAPPPSSAAAGPFSPLSEVEKEEASARPTLRQRLAARRKRAKESR